MRSSSVSTISLYDDELRRFSSIFLSRNKNKFYNMKTAVIVIAFFVAFVAADDKIPLIEAVVAYGRNCTASMNPSQETLDLVLKGQGEGNRDVQCFQACLAKDSGVMKDAKLNLDKMSALLITAKDVNVEGLIQFMELMKECKAVAEVTSDECEVAGNYGKCIKSKMPK